VDVAPAFPSSLVSLAQAGKIRCLAVLGEKRLKDFPGVPSAKELGFRSIVMSRVIYVPRDTPEDRLQILRQAFAKMQKDKTYLKLINKIGENTEYLDGLEYEKLRIKQKEQYSKLIEKIAGK
jgi:tripartite-type tricarboxylate transporter receptor subunit TctC